MLITVCYSLLTWIQGRQRAQVQSWLFHSLSITNHKLSILLLKERAFAECSSHYYSSEPNINCKFRAIKRQTSSLCLNSINSLQSTKLVREERGGLKVLELSPCQIVELRDWTGFSGTVIEESQLTIAQCDKTSKIYVLIEAEPGLTKDKTLYRKLTRFGEITGWKYDSADLALVLFSTISQITELMHLFRISNIILEGGWRIYRITTVICEGTFGTLISKDNEKLRKKSLTPADLRRLGAGVIDCGVGSSHCNTPKISIGSRGSLLGGSVESILEEAESEDKIEEPYLQNWSLRSPLKKKSTPSLYTPNDRNVNSKRKSSLSALTQKSSSLASLLFCSKSHSIDESDYQNPPNCINYTHKSFQQKSTDSLPLKLQNIEKIVGVAKKSENFQNKSATLPRTRKMSSYSEPILENMQSSYNKSGILGKSPLRSGKPPNILILSEDEEKNKKIATVLKKILSPDRYALYELKWDQLSVGGWEEGAALLIISGSIPSPTSLSILLAYLGDGGKLLSWCSNSSPFAPIWNTNNAGNNVGGVKNAVVLGCGGMRVSVGVRGGGEWGGRRVVETIDSGGISRPLTLSHLLKTESGESVVSCLDGGALGGKGICSQILFEECSSDKNAIELLGMLLTKYLGIEICKTSEKIEYCIGYLLGDHTKIQKFLSKVPESVVQSELNLEFVKRGEGGSKPSLNLFPIHYFECPDKFSTVSYFENLKTKELGRLLIYTDVISSVMNVLNGRGLEHGLTVVAGRQTSGRGRGKNVWLSPEGCAVFGIQLNFPIESGIGRRISILQHIAALAIILAVPHHKELEVRVKWPNDIYLKMDKIGGILVESTFERSSFRVNIGIGVNINNPYPTTCIFNALKEHEAKNKNNTSTQVGSNASKKESSLSIEKFIAEVLTHLEILIEKVGTEGGVEYVCDLYKSHWLHGNGTDEVRVEVEGGSFATCTVESIDEYGFLRVKELETGTIFSVQPDGNSFDITNRLIALKN